jgi:hypothetical protein
VGAPPGCFSFGLHGNPMGDSVQPATHRLRLANRAGFAGQDQESGLKGILGIVFIVQHAATNMPNQPAMSPKERSEGVLILALAKRAQ